MAAPNPMGISECAGTVKEVLRDLRKGKGLPTCKLVSSSGASASSTYVTYRRAELTPQCPEGTRQGVDGIVYHQGQRPSNSRHSGGVSNAFRSNDLKATLLNRTSKVYTQRVCVGGQDYGQAIVSNGYPIWHEDHEKIIHHYFEKIVVMTPDGADYEFDTFIDGKPHSRHRFSL